jgi:hypothetical protein
MRLVKIVALALTIGWVGEGVASPDDRPMPPRSPGELTWSLTKTRDGKALSVSFSVKNTTPKPIYVADRLVKAVGNGKFRREDRLVIMNGDDPQTVRFVVGSVSADVPSTVAYEPTYVAVAPLGSISRTLTVPLPLVSYNPVGATRPLSAKAERAILFVDILPAEPKWKTLEAEDGTRFKVPERELSQPRAESLPLPR